VVAGSYEFDLGGRVAPFCFILINGKLFLDIKVGGIELDEIVYESSRHWTYNPGDANGKRPYHSTH